MLLLCKIIIEILTFSLLSPSSRIQNYFSHEGHKESQRKFKEEEKYLFEDLCAY